ncbi:hypothetical protein C8A05DRAFT_20551, partial [Staphylotrichum tortipilum]
MSQAVSDLAVEVVYPEEKEGYQKPKPLVYAIGDNKVTQKWKSEWLAMPEDAIVKMDPSTKLGDPPTKCVDEERLLPLEQVAAYCRYAGTRYAFILTQTELVALRIRRVPPSATNKAARKKHHAAVEYAAVPWSAETGLTVNLAIWALACMGMNDEHRAMEKPGNLPLDAMARLTWWTLDSTRGVYQNVISKRQIPKAEWDIKGKPDFVQVTEDSGNSFTSAF